MLLGGGGVQSLVQKGLLNFVLANYFPHKLWLHIRNFDDVSVKKPASLKVIYYPFDGSGLIAKGGSSGSPGPSPTIRHCFASTIYKSLAQT